MDFQPQIFLQDGSLLYLVDEIKLLGVIITSDLKWQKNTKHIIMKANKRMWIIKRLKSMGANLEQLKLDFFQQVRSVLEIAVPVWNSSLTISDTLSIERVQKSFCHIALGKDYKGFNEAISSLRLKKLELRKLMLCRTFDVKTAQNRKFKEWFQLNKIKKNTRRKKLKYKKINARTKHYEK